MNKKVGLIILDGLGFTDQKEGNAFFLAKTPTIDSLLKQYPHCTLNASQLAVGLPKGQMGNSEIGHLNIGAGRTVLTDLVKINFDIEKNKYAKNKNLLETINSAKAKKVKFHVMGLLSDGGVHSQLSHILATLELCGVLNVPTVVHCFSDGRDTPVKNFKRYLAYVQLIIAKYKNIKLGTIGGRYYGMDRNKNWDRIEKALDALQCKGHSFDDVNQYIDSSYKNNVTDEFIAPAYNSKVDCKLEKNDVVFIANFRPDRVRQICHCLKQTKLYDKQSKLWELNVTLVTMVKYDGIDSDIILYPPQDYANTLGKVIADANLKQLRIAETEKYAHVTFFLDGGKELTYPNEDKILIPSPSVATYDLKPEMSAYEITNKLIGCMDKYDVVICNYANCDMVGHTGKLDATIKALQAVDACLAKVLAKAKQIGMTLFITADHGNCDDMRNNNTTHTLAPVFFICSDKSISLRDGNLNNIAPTILKYMGIKKPKEMDKDPLF